MIRTIVALPAALLLGAAGCLPQAGTEVTMDGKQMAVMSVRCNDHTVDGRQRILVFLQPAEQIELRADGVAWYRSKVLGTPMAEGGVRDFQVGQGAAFDATLDGHHLAGTVRCR